MVRWNSTHCTCVARYCSASAHGSQPWESQPSFDAAVANSTGVATCACAASATPAARPSNQLVKRFTFRDVRVVGPASTDSASGRRSRASPTKSELRNLVWAPKCSVVVVELHLLRLERVDGCCRGPERPETRTSFGGQKQQGRGQVDVWDTSRQFFDHCRLDVLSIKNTPCSLEARETKYVDV